MGWVGAPNMLTKLVYVCLVGVLALSWIWWWALFENTGANPASAWKIFPIMCGTLNRYICYTICCLNRILIALSFLYVFRTHTENLIILCGLFVATRIETRFALPAYPIYLFRPEECGGKINSRDTRHDLICCYGTNAGVYTDLWPCVMNWKRVKIQFYFWRTVLIISYRLVLWKGTLY